MLSRSYTLEFIMPCFCAGADQAKAEIRAPSIRGQLRWWFRALGGTRDEENQVFGGVHGGTTASAVIIRARILKRGEPWSPPKVDQNSPDSYVWYFASVSGKKAGVKGTGPRWTGPRWNSDAVLSPKSRIEITILNRHTLNLSLASKLDDAITCFFALGAIGLRATRGLGTFQCVQHTAEKSRHPSLERALSIIKSAGFDCKCLTPKLPDYTAIAKDIGSYLKGTRKALGMSGKRTHPSPFGSSDPRQTSSIYFRPTAVEGGYALYVFQAPPERVLEKRSRKPGPIVTKMVKASLSQKPSGSYHRR